MQVGSLNSNGMQQAVQSAQAVNDMLQNAVDKTQDVSEKLMGVAVQQKVGENAAANTGIDMRA